MLSTFLVNLVPKYMHKLPYMNKVCYGDQNCVNGLYGGSLRDCLNVIIREKHTKVKYTGMNVHSTIIFEYKKTLYMFTIKCLKVE